MTPRRVRRACLLCLILSACLLAGCGQVDVTADFYRDEKWEALLEVSFPRQTLSMYGASLADIDRQVEDAVAEAQSEGIRASVKKAETEDELVYTFTMKGQGFDKLSMVAFEEEADIHVEQVDGRRLVHFGYYVDPMLGLQPHNITLRGAEIIDGNGRLLDKHTMTWQNASGRLEATLTEQSRSSVGGVLGVGALVVVGVGLVSGGAYFWRRQRPARPVPCPWCGFWIPPGARFCPGCGRPRQ